MAVLTVQPGGTRWVSRPSSGATQAVFLGREARCWRSAGWWVYTQTSGRQRPGQDGAGLAAPPASRGPAQRLEKLAVSATASLL